MKVVISYAYWATVGIISHQLVDCEGGIYISFKYLPKGPLFKGEIQVILCVKPCFYLLVFNVVAKGLCRVCKKCSIVPNLDNGMVQCIRDLNGVIDGSWLAGVFHNGWLLNMVYVAWCNNMSWKVTVIHCDIPNWAVIHNVLTLILSILTFLLFSLLQWIKSMKIHVIHLECE